MRFLTVKSWCHMEVCSRSQDQHIKRIFDQSFLFWRKERKECGYHWTNGVVSMVYKSARPWTDIQDLNLDTLHWILAVTGSQWSECKMGVIGSDLEALTVSLAAAFWTLWSLSRKYCGTPETKHYNSPVWKVQRQIWVFWWHRRLNTDKSNWFAEVQCTLLI